MMMSRLGVDTDGYFELDDFRDVTIIADGTIIMAGGYKVLEHEEIIKILKESLS